VWHGCSTVEETTKRRKRSNPCLILIHPHFVSLEWYIKFYRSFRPLIYTLQYITILGILWHNSAIADFSISSGASMIVCIITKQRRRELGLLPGGNSHTKYAKYHFIALKLGFSCKETLYIISYFSDPICQIVITIYIKAHVLLQNKIWYIYFFLDCVINECLKALLTIVILWLLVMLMEETRVPCENHWPATNYWQTFHPIEQIIWNL
jgi:hypothetical protein